MTIATASTYHQLSASVPHFMRVAERLRREFNRRGLVYIRVEYDARNMARISTPTRELMVYATGAIEQAVTPRMEGGSRRYDPFASATFSRGHAMALDQAGSCRRAGHLGWANRALQHAVELPPCVRVRLP